MNETGNLLVLEGKRDNNVINRNQTLIKISIFVNIVLCLIGKIKALRNNVPLPLSYRALVFFCSLLQFYYHDCVRRHKPIESVTVGERHGNQHMHDLLKHLSISIHYKS